MTIERKYARKFNMFLEELTTNREYYREELSKVDNQLNDLVHFLENEKVNASVYAKVTKKIRNVRHYRREIKNNLSDIQSVFDSLKTGKKLKETIERDYTYRTNVLVDILSEDSQSIQQNLDGAQS